MLTHELMVQPPAVAHQGTPLAEVRRCHMLRSILIGLDGSACSSAAIELGIRWARRFDALLVGLGIVDEPTICKREPVPIGAVHFKVERDRHLLAHARRRVGAILEDFARRCDVEGVTYKVLEDVGTPDIQIMQKSRLYDLTMLGQQTYFRFETQNWPDETLQNVLRQGFRPVVAVPEVLRRGTCIVAAYNGSPQADRALRALQTLGLLNEDEVHVVSIQADLATAAELAEQAVDFLKLHGVRAVPHAFRPTMPVDKILLALVEQMQAHLLVMGASVRPTWQEYVFGSVTTSVLEASPVPLFLCR